MIVNYKQQMWQQRPGLRPAKEKKPYSIRILILVDGKISFYNSYFGLDELQQNLSNNPEWWVNFELILAHRDQELNANRGNPEITGSPILENFDVRDHRPLFEEGPDCIHELWLFGYSSKRGTKSRRAGLHPEELEIIHNWMNRGGGVFATGDHGQIGQALCGDLPRIRHMQLWNDPNPTVCATNSGQSYVNDTIVRRLDSFDLYQRSTSEDLLNSQSDDIPARIRVSPYRNYHLSSRSFEAESHCQVPYQPVFPHAVLSMKKTSRNPQGIIEHLPDHAHLGEVVPLDETRLSATYSLGKNDVPEFPTRLNGEPLTMEIPAWGWGSYHSKDEGKGNLPPRPATEFGMIGAWNGHLAVGDVGRIIVDASFHHWVDINLTGVSDFEPHLSPAYFCAEEKMGFRTEKGKEYLEEILTYHRNVALWLAPPSQQAIMAACAIWGSLTHTTLGSQIDPRMTTQIIGRQAIWHLSQKVGEVHVRSWWAALMPRENVLELLKPSKLNPNNGLLIILDEFMLGGLLKTCMQIMSTMNDLFVPDKDGLLEIMEIGLKSGRCEFRRYLETVQKATSHLIETL